MIRAVAILLIFLFVSSPALAAIGEATKTPIYNPASKSYFQLFDDNKNPGTWLAARVRAEEKVFKGVHGRLAVVDSAATNQFVLEHFGMRWHEASVWIGLRYWCSVRMLQWEGSLPYNPSDPDHFRLWHNPWARADEDACKASGSDRRGFAPVYYRNINGTVRWQAVGAAKFFTNYLVEFVTDGK